MTEWLIGITIAGGAIVLAGLAYWQLVIAEGSYLGQRIVTWLYDITAHRYDAIKGFDPIIEASFLGRPLARLLQDRPAPLVLDIGTGTGRLPQTLLEQPIFQGQIVGVDDSRKMLAVAAQKLAHYGSRFTLLWQDASSLPFRDAAFDAVACLEMLEFTPNPEWQLAEAVRVLRPGGVLLTTRRRGLQACLMPGKTYTAQTFTALLEKLGMVDVRIEAWQVDYDLVWAWRTGYMQRVGTHLLDVLRCLHCNNIGLQDWDEGLLCRQCGATYPRRNGLIEMRQVGG